MYFYKRPQCKAGFCCYIVIILVFILDSFLAQLAQLLVVIFLHLNVNVTERNTVNVTERNTLPHFCDVSKFVFCYGFRQYDFS